MDIHGISLVAPWAHPLPYPYASAPKSGELLGQGGLIIEISMDWFKENSAGILFFPPLKYMRYVFFLGFRFWSW